MGEVVPTLATRTSRRIASRKATGASKEDKVQQDELKGERISFPPSTCFYSPIVCGLHFLINYAARGLHFLIICGISNFLMLISLSCSCCLRCEM
jgi:hypothetical protein